MGFDVAISHQQDFTRVAVIGAPSVDELLSMIHLLGVESGNWETELVLVDLRGVRTQFTEADQFQIGREAACSLAHVRRIASVVPQERITRISEKAARRNGVDVRVFAREQEAISWLRERTQEPQQVPAKVSPRSALRRLLG